MIFKPGDKVTFAGIYGTVDRYVKAFSHTTHKIWVRFAQHNNNGLYGVYGVYYIDYPFLEDGRLEEWHLESLLKKLEK